MRHLETFVKQTAAGQLITIVKEHYVREDIECVLTAFLRAFIA
jgi:hypothetical protein